MATRLGIIGAGIMGERMLRAALEHARDVVDVTGVWDADPAALDRLGVLMPSRAASAAQVIDGADCVYVATPPATHIPYAEQALAAGRAVFLEKPLATDVAAAEAFAESQGQARVAVNFPFASSFAVERLKAWLEDGEVDKPASLAIRVAFRTWPRPWQHAAASWLDAPAEGGFTREVVSHFLFLTVRLFSRLDLHEAAAFYQKGGTERRVTARLMANTVPELASGQPHRTGFASYMPAIPVTLEGSIGLVQADDHNTWTLSSPVPGRGAVRLRDWSFAERQGPDGQWHADPDALPNEKMRPLVLRRQLEAVARMTRGEPHALATLAEALAVQRVVEGILAEARHA